MPIADPAKPEPRAARRDAVRNRARLVEAAGQAFSEDGLGVSVNDIAARAGVNVATLYRHFATKDDLIAAVLEEVLAPLAAARDRALLAEDTGVALATFAHDVARMQSEHRGLVDALRNPGSEKVRERLREASVAIVTPLVERAHADRELREDFGALDLLVALRMVAVVAEAPGLGPDAVSRYVDVVLRGLRPD